MATIVKVGRVTRNRLRLGDTSIALVEDGGTDVDLEDKEITRDMHRWGGRWVIIGAGVKVAKVALADAATGGGVFSWTNPEAGDILVSKVVLDVTTAATGAATIDVGPTPTSATTSSDTSIDGLDVNAAAGVFSSADDTDNGVNGVAKEQKVGEGEWVTASQATGDVSDLAGFAHIFYVSA